MNSGPQVPPIEKLRGQQLAVGHHVDREAPAFETGRSAQRSPESRQIAIAGAQLYRELGIARGAMKQIIDRAKVAESVIGEFFAIAPPEFSQSSSRPI